MKTKNTFKRLICFVLCAVTLASVIPSLSVFANTDIPDTDFSDPDGEKITVSPSHILKMLYSDGVSDAEAEYADKYFDTVFLYSDGVSPEDLLVTVNGSDIVLTARPKIYTAENGVTVEWLPVCATCGDDTSTLKRNGDVYSCDFSSPDADAVSVEYECAIELPEDYASSLANFAYNDTVLADKTLSAHQDALQSYITAMENYTLYLKELDLYNNKSAAYAEYLERKSIYDESLARYNRYLAALAQYESDLIAYNNYLEKMKAYEAEKAAYEKAYAENAAEYEEYRRYLENLQAIRTSTYAMESMFVRPQNGVGPLFNALQNKELVSMIEKYDDELVNLYGVKREDVNSMRTVSDELNELLRGYSDARDESEQAAFEFYSDNYADICEKFNFLYDKMTAVLTDTIYIHVCALIEVEYKSDPDMATYKKWRIRNVLCHIYLICQVLDDSVTASESWDFYLENGDKHTYNFSDLLAQNVILSDTDSADPKGLEWWSGEIPGSDLPKAPVKPVEVKEPSKPMEVAKPNAEPTPVSPPGEAPEEVLPPSTRPEIENYDTVLRVQYYLSEAELEKREIPKSPTVTFTRTVNRPFSLDGQALTVYYGADGTATSVNSEPAAPTLESTAQYIYSFDGWKKVESGNDILFLPIFTATEQSYTVSFKYSDTSEVLCTKEYKYGETPVYDGALPTRASTPTANYTFAGWSPQIRPVTEDTVYIAAFTQTERLYTVTWSILDETLTRSLSYNTSPVIPSVRKETYIGGTLYTFTGWDKTPAPVTESVTYTAQFAKTELASVSEDNDVSIYKSDTAYVLSTSGDSVKLFELLLLADSNGCEVHINTNDLSLIIPKNTVSSLTDYGAHTLSLVSSEKGVGYTFKNISGYDIRFSGEVYMTLPCTDDQAENPFVYADGKNRLPCTVFGNEAEFVSQAGVYYKVSRYYSLTVEYGDGGAVFAPATLYPAGTELGLRILPNAEFTVSKITLTDKNGTVTEFTSADGLCMPACDATVAVEFDAKKYEIRFMLGGDVIATEYYALGETVVVPEIELTFEKDGFLYTFIGWSHPIGIVTGNATYTAKYYSIRIEDVPSEDTQTALNKVITAQVLPVVLVIFAVAAVVTATVISVKKKRKITDDKAPSDEEDGRGETK